MTGLYGFLCFLENQPKVKKVIEHYGNGRGKEFFEFCILYRLVTRQGHNSVGQELFSLTKQGEELIRSQNFNDTLNYIMNEVQK